MKYAVICYSIHDKEIISYKWFNDYVSAEIFLNDDAISVYDNEISNNNVSEIINIDGNFANVITYDRKYDCKYEWTWHIIKNDID